MNSKTKGILCIVTAAFCFAFMSLCVRLAGDLPSMQKILFRNLLAFFIVGAGLVRKPEKLEIHKGDLKFLFLRSICGTVGIVCNFYAIDHLVLSDANMLNKLSPFFTIIFSYFLLKERLTLFQGIAVVVAFMGALFIPSNPQEICQTRQRLLECWEVREPVQPIALCVCWEKEG